MLIWILEVFKKPDGRQETDTRDMRLVCDYESGVPDTETAEWKTTGLSKIDIYSIAMVAQHQRVGHV